MTVHTWLLIDLLCLCVPVGVSKMKGSPAGEKREEPHAQEPEQVIETSGHPDLPHHRRHTSAGGSGPREGSQYAYRHRNSSGVIGSDAPLLDRRLSSIAPRRSGSFASIQELTGIEFNPPPTDADDNYWFACKWLPSRHTCKSIAPAEVKEVRPWTSHSFRSQAQNSCLHHLYYASLLT